MPPKDARLVIDAVIIKHKLCLSDGEIVAQIQEKPYLEYFVGLPGYQMEALFAAALFVEVRKRMGKTEFDVCEAAIIDSVESSGCVRSDACLGPVACTGSCKPTKADVGGTYDAQFCNDDRSDREFSSNGGRCGSQPHSRCAGHHATNVCMGKNQRASISVGLDPRHPHGWCYRARASGYQYCPALA
jgi:hypothetical protein